MKKFILCLGMIFGLQFGQNLPAQNKNAELSVLVDQILSERKISLNLLPKYSWTSRIEILKSKEIMNIMIEKNQYDQRGQLVQKILNEQGAKMPKAFLIKEIAEAEKKTWRSSFTGSVISLRDIRSRKPIRSNGLFPQLPGKWLIRLMSLFLQEEMWRKKEIR